jgi:voltage-gated potassium channel
MTSSVRHLRSGAIFLVSVCFVAVVGYVLAGWSWLDAAYMSVITVFSVGYGEVEPITTPGLKIFTMLFIGLGCTGYLYIGGSLVQFLIEGQIETTLGNRRMNKSIQSLSNHTIICGYGRVGRMVAAELHFAGHPFVIIEQNEAFNPSLVEKGYLFLHADATSESALTEAGIERANQIAVVRPNDAMNVFITLSARNLNAELVIIARGMAPSTEGKLKQAGANRVVLPEHIGAERIAGLILRPNSSLLMKEDILLSHIAPDLADLGLDIEEFSIPQGSNLAGMTLSALETKGSSAFLIVSIVRAGGEVIRRPSLETPLASGDILITLCHRGEAPEFTRIFAVKREIQYRGAKFSG